MPSVTNITTSHVLSTLLSQFGQGSFIADQVAPAVLVKDRSGTYFATGSEEMKGRNGERKAGAMTDRMDFDISSSTYKTVPYGWHSPLPQDVLDNQESPLDLRATATQKLARLLFLMRELRVEALAQSTTTISTYSAVSAAWNGAGAVDIKKDIDTAKEAVRAARGAYPNAVILSPGVRNAVVNYLLNKAQVTYGEIARTVELPPLLWDMKPLVPLCVQNTSDLGQTASFSNVWNDYVTVLVTEPASLMYNGTFLSPRRTKIGPSGYRTRTWYDEAVETEFVEVQCEEDEVTVNAKSAYILTGALG